MGKKLNQKQWQGEHKIVPKHEQNQGSIFNLVSSNTDSFGVAHVKPLNFTSSITLGIKGSSHA